MSLPGRPRPHLRNVAFEYLLEHLDEDVNRRDLAIHCYGSWDKDKARSLSISLERSEQEWGPKGYTLVFVSDHVFRLERKVDHVRSARATRLDSEFALKKRDPFPVARDRFYANSRPRYGR